MKKTGHADLPLHYGRVPAWLYERMQKLGGAITEAVIQDYGTSGFLARISDPFWFQSLGCVMGMDWHSSGITTSVLGALKRAINPVSHALGLHICGGRGRYSRQTPSELMQRAHQAGLDGHELVRCSRLTAKVDNTAVQDGFQIYLHTFILTDDGEWAVVQQGMNGTSQSARRYHWHSVGLKSFVREPHTSVCGDDQGAILNLTDRHAKPTHMGMLDLAREKPGRIIREIANLKMPAHHHVTSRDVDLRRLGAVLALAHEKECQDFESLLLLEGLGPRTIQSLALVSEVIHGTPVRFRDPARFSFAHGGKDGHPFPVPTRVYDETITVLQKAVSRARIGMLEKKKAIDRLHRMALKVEKDFHPQDHLDAIIDKERQKSQRYGGRTIFNDKKRSAIRQSPSQLTLF